MQLKMVRNAQTLTANTWKRWRRQTQASAESSAIRLRGFTQNSVSPSLPPQPSLTRAAEDALQIPQLWSELPSPPATLSAVYGHGLPGPRAKAAGGNVAPHCHCVRANSEACTETRATVVSRLPARESQPQRRVCSVSRAAVPPQSVPCKPEPLRHHLITQSS